jgi:hypothetical protein
MVASCVKAERGVDVPEADSGDKLSLVEHPTEACRTVYGEDSWPWGCRGVVGEVLVRMNSWGESKSVEMHGIRRVTSRLQMTPAGFWRDSKMTKAPRQGLGKIDD